LNLRERAKKLEVDIPAVFIALKHKETPIWAKLFATITIFYALSPIDLIPDFIPVLGYLDDLIILPLLIVLTIKLIPRDLFESYRIEAKDMWASGRQKKWYYAIPFVIIWIAILGFIIKLFI